MSAIIENHGIASINFDCFTIDESNQVKISRKIMRCQGYFLKIALGTRLVFKVKWNKSLGKHSDMQFRGTSVSFWLTLHGGVKHI